MFPDHNGTKLEINSKRKFGETRKIHFPWAKEEIKMEIRKHFEINENEGTIYIRVPGSR